MLCCLARLAYDRRYEFHLTPRQVDRKLSLYYCACCRLRSELLGDEARHALEVIERRADGAVGRREWVTTRRTIEGLDRSAWAAARRGPYSAERWNLALLTGLLVAAAEASHVQRGEITRGTWPVGGNHQASLLREILGDPFEPVVLETEWLTTTVRTLARTIHTERAYELMPVLGDALQDAGCDHPAILEHCYTPAPHSLGCWLIDAILGNG